MKWLLLFHLYFFFQMAHYNKVHNKEVNCRNIREAAMTAIIRRCSICVCLQGAAVSEKASFIVETLLEDA